MKSAGEPGPGNTDYKEEGAGDGSGNTGGRAAEDLSGQGEAGGVEGKRGGAVPSSLQREAGGEAHRFPGGGRGDSGLYGTERGRQIHHHQDAYRHSASDGWNGGGAGAVPLGGTAAAGFSGGVCLRAEIPAVVPSAPSGFLRAAGQHLRASQGRIPPPPG
ncbi:hypothetical protein D3C75_665880 [compost metagenome]